MKHYAWDSSEMIARAARCWIAVACLAGFALLPATATAAQSIEITRGEILVGADSSEPPPDSAAWQAVSLPDNWMKSRPGVTGYAWYRFHFDLPTQPSGRHALYIHRMRTVGSAFVNGREVGQYGQFGEANRGPRPQLFEFSPTLVQPGRNTLHVRLWVPEGYLGALSPIEVGTPAAMAAALERDRFISTSISQYTGVIGGVLGAMMLVIWLGRRHDTMFGWFALAALSMALFVTLRRDANPVLPGEAMMLLLVPLLVPLSIYCLRFAGWRWPRFERALWIAAIGYSLSGEQHVPFAVWYPLWLFLLAAPVFLMGLIVLRKPGVESILLFVAHLLSVAWVQYFAFFNPGFVWMDFQKTHTLPLFLVMAWILTRRFVASLNEAESLNANLERRVAEKAAELDRNAAQTQQLVRDAAVAAERQRIMSDMHDGIGGQLISTLDLVESGEASSDQVAAALRECIDDLRLAIDSLEPTHEDLLPVLGNLRYRLEPRLKARGIELDWQVKDVPKLACLTPQNVLHVLRILQEAFTNVLRHAGAKRIRVSTRSEGGKVLIDVSDDGVGMSGEAKPEGHGLANMRRRSAALGGELLLHPSQQGTTVTLSLPEELPQPA